MIKYWPHFYKEGHSNIGLGVVKPPAGCVCPSFLFLSYLLNVTAITQPVISQTVMMQGAQPLAGGEGALTTRGCRMSPAYREANALRSCALWVSVIMHWTDYEPGMFLVLKGGKTTLFSLIPTIVPYLQHDIKPEWTKTDFTTTYTSTMSSL